jgi:hypothetical protein
MTESAMPVWWANGLLCENCNCQVVCPGHVHFSQLCTHDRCKGWWAVRFDEGEYGAVPLRGVTAVIAYDSPRHMIAGGWTQSLIVDASVSAAQRDAVERIVSGAVGGPWVVLARFVGRRLETRSLPVRIEDAGKTKRIVIDGLLDGVLEAIRGRDRERTVTFENMFNQIHAPSQVVARGTTNLDDGTLVVRTEGTHGLWSSFRWSNAG